MDISRVPGNQGPGTIGTRLIRKLEITGVGGLPELVGSHFLQAGRVFEGRQCDQAQRLLPAVVVNAGNDSIITYAKGHQGSGRIAVHPHGFHRRIVGILGQLPHVQPDGERACSCFGAGLTKSADMGNWCLGHNPALGVKAQVARRRSVPPAGEASAPLPGSIT